MIIKCTSHEISLIKCHCSCINTKDSSMSLNIAWHEIMKTKPKIINSVRHCPSKSFSNKCNYARHVNSINAEVIVILSGSSIMAPWTSCVSLCPWSNAPRSTLSKVHGCWDIFCSPRSISLLMGLPSHFVNKK